MGLVRLLRIAVASGLVLLGFVSSLAANPLVREIDIRPIINRHSGVGNAYGLAVDAAGQRMYLSHESDSPNPAWLYTLDMNGALVSELNWTTFYGPNCSPEGLAYDAATGVLHVQVSCHDGNFNNFTASVVDIDPSGPTILGGFPLSGPNLGFEQRSDGYWLALNAPNRLRHLDPAGAFLEDVPFEGFPGTFAYGVASTFTGDGFFLADHFGRRIVEVDRQGSLVRAGSTGFLPIGGSIAFETDPAARLFYVQAGNMVIYVLNEEVMDIPVVLEQATWGSVKTRYR